VNTRRDEWYGDNFPVAEGWYWDPRVPWRHPHVMPIPPRPWLGRIGWWLVVLVGLGILGLVAAHDGFSAEMPASTALIVRFHEGAVQLPDGTVRALSPHVAFSSASLQRLNARYGLVVVEQVVSPTQVTSRTFRLLFASTTTAARAVLAYRHDPSVISADIARISPEGGRAPAPMVDPTVDV